MLRVCLFVFAAAIFVAATSAHGEEVSCDYRECMNICRSKYEPGCVRMCGRIISLCKQLVPKPERTRNAQRAFSARGHIGLYAQARSSRGRIN